ncbi:hypothetical protein [Eubacterium aggregans]|uniref:hypothetical protein n=1 Tax=Eubacterium aggregans TaxID=81409 RepID=UPI003F300AB3
MSALPLGALAATTTAMETITLEEPSTTEESEIEAAPTHSPTTESYGTEEDIVVIDTVGSVDISEWTVSKTGTVLNITRYTGTGVADVVVPNIQDFRDAGADQGCTTASITRNALNGSASVANSSKGTFEISKTDNEKVVISDTYLDCFKFKTDLTSIDLGNLDTSNLTDMNLI